MAQNTQPEAGPSSRFLERFREVAGGSGELRFDAFVALALYDPVIGYYRADRQRVGRAAGTDFYTATSSGGLLRELLLGACNTLMAEVDLADYTFVEIGAEPGTGVLPNGALHPFREVLTLRLGDRLEVPDKAIVFSNELFDAQPFRSFVSTGAAWEELWVRLTADTLCEFRRPLVPAETPTELGGLVRPQGYRLDLSFAARDLARTLSAPGWAGLFLAFDYGKSWEALTNEYPAGTARAYFQHRQSTDLLARPGEQDLTCHVCWDWLDHVLKENGFRTLQLHSQEAFFMHHAAPTIERIVTEEASRLSPRKMGLMQLLHPGNMGQKFQVLAAVRGGPQTAKSEWRSRE